MPRRFSRSAQNFLQKGITTGGCFVCCSFLASTLGADTSEFEYGRESAIWVHEAPKETKVEKTLFVTPNGNQKAKARVKVTMKASAKGPEADLPGAPPRGVAVSFEGEASLSAGDFRVESHPQGKDADSPAKGRRHASRLMRGLGGGRMEEYVAGVVVPLDGGDVSLEAVELEKSEPIMGRDTGPLHSYIVSSKAHLGVVEYAIDLLLTGVVTDALNRPVPSRETELEGTFNWELAVAFRVWKRIRATDGKESGEWLHGWEETATNEGWMIPPSTKSVDETKDN